MGREGGRGEQGTGSGPETAFLGFFQKTLTPPTRASLL